jgi:hypothetical protein
VPGLAAEVIIDVASSREVFERSREASGAERLEAQRERRFFPRFLSGVEGPRALCAWKLNPRTLRFARSALPKPKNQTLIHRSLKALTLPSPGGRGFLFD